MRFVKPTCTEALNDENQEIIQLPFGFRIAKKMTAEHNSDNVTEVKRILSEHPVEEERDIIKGDRLLGILAPLRAFGDFKFKWPEETINQVCLFFIYWTIPCSRLY